MWPLLEQSSRYLGWGESQLMVGQRRAALHLPLLGLLESGLEVVEAVFGTHRLAVVDTEFTPTSVAEIAVTSLLRHGVFRTMRDADRFRAGEPVAPHRFRLHWEVPTSFLVEPPDVVTSHLTRASGITAADVAGAGTFGEHTPRLAHLLADCEYLVGWNIANDRNRLEAEFRRARVSTGTMVWVDLAVMFHRLHPEVGANPKRVCKLAEAAAFYGIALDPAEAHNALFDVVATCQVLGRVCDEWLAADRDDLNIALTGWHGQGWSPTVHAAPWAPIRIRMPAAHAHLGRALARRDAGLRYQRELAGPALASLAAHPWPEVPAHLADDYDETNQRHRQAVLFADWSSRGPGARWLARADEHQAQARAEDARWRDLARTARPGPPQATA